MTEKGGAAPLFASQIHSPGYFDTLEGGAQPLSKVLKYPGGRPKNGGQRPPFSYRKSTSAPGDQPTRVRVPTSSTGRPKTLRIEIRTGVSTPSIFTS